MTLSTSDADLAAAATDFGNRIERRPAAVLFPGSAAEIAATVSSAGLPVTARGAGHSVDGQAQTAGGIVVRTTTLTEVGEVDADRVSVAAGATWAAVVGVTLPRGLVPPVLPDYLELTVGGTLSAGGIGGTSHHFGSQADNVFDLDVVTPAGELLTCSPQRHRDLFDRVRATQGRHGIITRATLALRPAPREVRRYLLVYRDLGRFLADQRALVGERRFDHLLGQARRGPRGWEYVLEAVSHDRPDDRRMLAGLGHAHGEEQINTLGYGTFLARLAPWEAALRSTGSWQHRPHPRCNVLLPGRHAEAVVSSELATGELGEDGTVLLYAIPTDRLAAPRMPRADDPLTVVFGMQRTAPAGDAETLDRMLTANALLRGTAKRLGGAVYAGAES